MLFRTRDLLVRQRTQTINALRGHLAEFGVVAPQGPAHLTRLAAAVGDPASGLPEAVRLGVGRPEGWSPPDPHQSRRITHLPAFAVRRVQAGSGRFRGALLQGTHEGRGNPEDALPKRALEERGNPE